MFIKSKKYTDKIFNKNAKTKKNDSPGAFISIRQKYIRYYNSKRLLIIVKLSNQSDLTLHYGNHFHTHFSYTRLTSISLNEATAEISTNAK